MADFNISADIVLGHEGGYVCIAGDAGGETRYGISKRFYPQEDIFNLTLDRAKFLYRRDFWEPILGDYIESQVLADLLMDFAVNSGVREAVRCLQKVVGAVPDGVAGPETVKAANAHPRAYRELLKARFRLYASIVHDHPGQSQFLPGWINRALDFIA